MGATLGIGLTLLDNYKKEKQYIKERKELDDKLDLLYKEILKINKDKINKIIEENNFKEITSYKDFINLKISFSIYDKPEVDNKEHKIINNTKIEKLDEFLELYNKSKKLDKKLELVSNRDCIIDNSYKQIGWLGEKIKEIKNVKSLEDGIILSLNDIEELIKITLNIKEWNEEEVEEYLKEQIFEKLRKIKKYIDNEIICIAKTF